MGLRYRGCRFSNRHSKRDWEGMKDTIPMDERGEGKKISLQFIITGIPRTQGILNKRTKTFSGLSLYSTGARDLAWLSHQRDSVLELAFSVGFLS